jgi:signal transduction histidine kinase
LIFKESINNVLKHSGCTEVSVDFHLESDRLRLQVKDNGRGFDASRDSVGNGGAGNGLPSMRRRTQDLGGAFVLQSEQGSGTTVNLEIPLSKQVEKYAATIDDSPLVD